MTRRSGSSSSRFQSFLRRWGGIGLILVVLGFGLYLVFGDNGGVVEVLSLKKERDRLQQDVVRLKAEKEELEKQIDLLEKADPYLIESEARRKGMVRKGEEVYRLEYEEIPDSTRSPEQSGRSEGR